jgi:cyanophycin synthetase
MGRAIQLSEQQSLCAPPEAWIAPPLEVRSVSVYRGPHLYSHTPMIRIEVDLGLLEEWPTNRLGGFTERLLERLPGLRQHGCSSGKPGGLVQRLQDGTWIGHVIEHVAIELQCMIGFAVTRGKTRSVKGCPGRYNILYEYADEATGLRAGHAAFELVSSLLDPPFHGFKGLSRICKPDGQGVFDFDAILADLKQLSKASRLGPTTQSLVTEAERRGIPWVRLDEHSLVQFGTGRYQKRIRASITSATSHLGVETAGDKNLTKRLLSEAGIPVPKGGLATTAAEAVSLAKRIQGPVTIKPLNANHGRGVSTNLGDEAAITAAFERARQHSRRVIVEQFFVGHDYRVLVVKGEVVAVAERVPAHVVGTGKDTIETLIGALNSDPRRGDGHEEAMTKIVIDDGLLYFLSTSGLSLNTVPANGQRVVLAATANLSTGGTAVDKTDVVHPDNISIARRAALVVGLDVAGIDVILPDITRSWRETGGGIIEVNASPGFRMHLRPAEGKNRDVARPVLDCLYPRGAPTQVPVAMITGTNGKSTTVRMLAHILRGEGKNVGFTSTSGIYVNEECICKGDASGPKSARLLLREPTIDVAILETARGGILREGLGVAACDVGCVLNISADHLGLSGIQTLEDLAAVKSVVTESVHRRGTSVLNADDPRTLVMSRHAGGTICYFSRHSVLSGPVKEHVENGGAAVTCERIGREDYIVLHRDGRRISVVAIPAIPATFEGRAAFNVENALAATAMAAGLGVSAPAIQSALTSFTSSFEQNPGRFNIYDGHGFRVVMDYAHNPAALRTFFGTIRDMRAHYRRVIGHVSTPGDRRDEDILEVGAIAARGLDLCVFRELPDTRGRQTGEVLSLLKKGALSAGCAPDRIICVRPEEEATAICLRSARPGDLVILMPSKIESAWKQMLDFKPAGTQHEQPRVKELAHYA